jgi:glycosyltransferase involved in cell wall biosynthesis
MENEIDIVVTAFNVKEPLLDCLKSIFDNKKDGDTWNVVVVDNASKDGTVSEVRKKFPDVKVVVSKKNL